MNALELMSRIGGETLNNKIRASVDGKIVILARMIGTEWEYTPEGQELANAHSNQAVVEAEVEAEVEVKATRTRKSKDTPVEPVAVESADVEPEL
jgi:hypothetical protein